jgi:hypothetical protein
MTAVPATAPASGEWLRKPFSTGESRLIALEAAIGAALIAVNAQGMWDLPWRLLLISLAVMCFASIVQRTGPRSSVDLSIVFAVCLAIVALYLDAPVLLAAAALMALALILSWTEGQSALRRAALSSAIRDSLARAIGWIVVIVASLAAADRTERTVFEAALRTPLEGLALSAGILAGGVLLVILAASVWALPRIAASRLAAGKALPLAAGDALWFCALSGAAGIVIDVRAILSKGVFSEQVGRGCWLALTASFAFCAARLFFPAQHDAAVQPLWILYIGAPGSKRVFRSHAARLATRWPNGPVTMVAEPDAALRWGGAHLRSAMLRGQVDALFPQRAIEVADWLDTLPPRERWQSMPVRELYPRPSLWPELFETRLEPEAVIVVIADGEPDEKTVDRLRAMLPTARTSFHLPAGPREPAIARWPGVEADPIVGAPPAFMSYWVATNAKKEEKAGRLRFVLIEHDGSDREFAARLAETLQGKTDANGRMIRAGRIDLSRSPTRRSVQRSLLRVLSANVLLARLLFRWIRYEELGDLLVLLMDRRGVHEVDLICVESAAGTSSLFNARSAHFADRVMAILPAVGTPAWRLPIREYRDVIRRSDSDLQTQVDELAARYLALSVRPSPAPKADDGAFRSKLRRVALSEIPEARRWQVGAAWDIEFHRIQTYINDRASHDVVARMEERPSERAAGAKLAGKGVSDEVNLIYGAMTSSPGADVIGKASRGELERIAPSPWTIRLLHAGTFVTVMIEVGKFVIMWLTRAGNVMPIAVGMLLAGFGYLAGEGLGRLLIAGGDKEQRAGAISWVFLMTGAMGIGAVTRIGYLAASVALMTLPPAAIAVFHAAQMERSHKRQRLVAQMFSVQLFFSAHQARQSYLENRWITLYDQAVEALTHHAFAAPIVEPKQW